MGYNRTMGKGVTFSNFRDMGGLELPSGGVIKAGKLYRTCKLRPKNGDDKRFLASLGLDCVIDFRTPEEVKEKPDKLPKGVEYVNASVFGDTKFRILAPTRKSCFAMLSCTDAQFDEIMDGVRDAYEYMPYAKHAYSELFSRMNEGKTIAFHCTAGKDRTGVAAMIIELALGRTRRQALEEYMRSNNRKTGKTARLMKLVKPLRLSDKFYECVRYNSRVHEELFDRAWNAIFDKYATIEDFLLAEYGVTAENIADWKRYYTE